MNMITIPRFAVKLVLLLLALLPLHQVLAQKAQKESLEIHLKLKRTADGKTVVIDTTFSAASHEELIKAIKAANLDTAHFPMLRAYTLDAEGRGRLKGMAIDTARLRSLADVHMRVIVADSLAGKGERHIEIIKIDGESMSLKGHPGLHTWTEKDSGRAFTIKEGKHTMAISPGEGERVVVKRIPGHSKSDSMMRKEGNSFIKIITEAETGDHKIFRIEADGKEVEVKGEDVGLGIAKPDRRAIFIVRKARVEDITAHEKEQLKATGAPVETKSREELKVEEINYHPNPNNGRFNLSFTLKNKGTTVVRIMDDKGREVFVDTVEKLSGEYSRQIDISSFGSGLYFLQVAQNGRYHTKKLLVQ
ncbi:T9SS type A sorting domain-containing protein [Pontibacter sp. JH31]|uniref:T9SS type A sorting domain-containing protein n=1 Tax=Pontibacter aquaedesilientis TaxID=2766980 RepID=A0ABR7XBB2_9BACT|nr:T9SS type A sorting domain-containing protein [Pontibacter aquaedesilientis]MBD1395598.1 T9SS type A sorting domain-containing protein [Pontibacter aquaedesilientis]